MALITCALSLWQGWSDARERASGTTMSVAHAFCIAVYGMSQAFGGTPALPCLPAALLLFSSSATGSIPALLLPLLSAVMVPAVTFRNLFLSPVPILLTVFSAALAALSRICASTRTEGSAIAEQDNTSPGNEEDLGSPQLTTALRFAAYADPVLPGEILHHCDRRVVLSVGTTVVPESPRVTALPEVPGAQGPYDRPSRPSSAVELKQGSDLSLEGSTLLWSVQSLVESESVYQGFQGASVCTLDEGSSAGLIVERSRCMCGI